MRHLVDDYADALAAAIPVLADLDESTKLAHQPHPMLSTFRAPPQVTVEADGSVPRALGSRRGGDREGVHVTHHMTTDDYAQACRSAMALEGLADDFALNLYRSGDEEGAARLSGIAEWIPADVAGPSPFAGIARSVDEPLAYGGYSPPLIATRKPYRDAKPANSTLEDLAVASDAEREAREYGPGSRAGALRHEIGIEFEYLGRSRSDATTAKRRRADDPWEAPDPRVDWIDRAPAPSRYPFQSSKWVRLRAQREVDRRAAITVGSKLVERDGDLFWGGVRVTSDPNVPDGRSYGLASGAAMRVYRDAETEISERASDAVDSLRYAMASMYMVQQSASMAFVSPEIAARLANYTADDEEGDTW